MVPEAVQTSPMLPWPQDYKLKKISVQGLVGRQINITANNSRDIRVAPG